MVYLQMLIGKNFGMRMKVKKYQKAPNFKLDSTDSKVFELSKVKNGIIIYFYLEIIHLVAL